MLIYSAKTDLEKSSFIKLKIAFKIVIKIFEKLFFLLRLLTINKMTLKANVLYQMTLKWLNVLL